jgi:group I intron endonuclease
VRNSFKAYRVTNRLNEKVYIGVTKRAVVERWRSHVLCALRGTTMGPFPDAIRKYGPESFMVEHIASASCWDDLCVTEKALIEQHNSFEAGYNATKGGEGAFGVRQSVEHKARRVTSYLRTLASQGGCALKGRSIRPETKAKISAAHKGRSFSAETIMKMSAGQKRRVRTQSEQERFLRDGTKARIMSRALTDEQAKCARRQRAEGVYLKDLATFYGVSTSAIYDVVRGVTYKHVPMFGAEIGATL